MFSHISRMIMVACLTGLFLFACRSMDTRSDIKLVGGDVVPEGKFSATFMLRTGCTATKIAANKILTAAHCVISKPFKDIKPQFLPDPDWPLTISTARTVYYDKESGNIDLSVKKTYVNPEYMKECLKNCDKSRSLSFIEPNPHDVAVVEIENPSKQFSDMPTAPLLDRPLNPQSDQVIVMGYGCQEGAKVHMKAPFPLKYKKVRLLQAKEVKDSGRIPVAMHDSFLKNFYQTPGQNFQKDSAILGDTTASLCPGDSGGPLYVDDNGTYKVVAVNSFMVTPENDDVGISSINAHARFDEQSSKKVHTWLVEILKDSAAPPANEENDNRKLNIGYGDKIHEMEITSAQPEIQLEVENVPFGRYALSTLAAYHTEAEVIDLSSGEPLQFEKPNEKKPRDDGRVFTWHDITLKFNEPRTIQIKIRAKNNATGPLTVRFKGDQGCRFCRLVMKLDKGLLKKKNERGKRLPRSETEMLYMVYHTLKNAGYNSWVYRNSIEISRKHKKVWMNVKLEPGGSATSNFDGKDYWYVRKKDLKAALKTSGISLKYISSYVEELH